MSVDFDLHCLPMTDGSDSRCAIRIRVSVRRKTPGSTNIPETNGLNKFPCNLLEKKPIVWNKVRKLIWISVVNQVASFKIVWSFAQRRILCNLSDVSSTTITCVLHTLKFWLHSDKSFEWFRDLSCYSRPYLVIPVFCNVSSWFLSKSAWTRQLFNLFAGKFTSRRSPLIEIVRGATEKFLISSEQRSNFLNFSANNKGKRSTFQCKRGEVFHLCNYSNNQTGSNLHV